jgi:nanoRNase/pAp phosphatase (c-di-AMP/oligoRNAs hydrolase)
VSWSLCMGEYKGQMTISLRSTSRKYRAGTVLRRLIGTTGSAGGHRGMAGAQVPLSALSKCERQELPAKLINKFLGLIGRQGAAPQPLVQSVEA